MTRQPPLFQFEHGDHICVLYRSEDFLVELLTSYILEGLQRRERFFCAQKPHVLRRLRKSLRSAGVDPNLEIERGSLEFHTESQAYFSKGRFEPSLMMELLINAIDNATRQGFTCLRTAGDLSWAATNPGDYERVLEYERLVEMCYPGRVATGICQYCVSDFSGNHLDSAQNLHGKTVSENSHESRYARLSLRFANASAEIVAGRSPENLGYNYVVQHGENQETMGWGSASSYAEAASQASRIAGRAVH